MVKIVTGIMVLSVFLGCAVSDEIRNTNATQDAYTSQMYHWKIVLTNGQETDIIATQCKLGYVTGASTWGNAVQTTYRVDCYGDDLIAGMVSAANTNVVFSSDDAVYVERGDQVE